MITSPNEILHTHSLNYSSAPCSRCSEDTANVCAKCGALKCEEIDHIGRLPAGAHDVMTGKNPSWKMLRISTVMGISGGFLIGFDHQTLLSWIGF